MKTLTCTYCGNTLREEELEEPLMDDEENVICYECYNDHFEFKCCKCEEYDHIDNQHKMLVVVDEEEAGLPAGLYRILELPYYSASLLGDVSWNEWALERIGDVPDGVDTGSYACGHLCGRCQEEVLKKLNRGELDVKSI